MIYLVKETLIKAISLKCKFKGSNSYQEKTKGGKVFWNWIRQEQMQILCFLHEY